MIIINADDYGQNKKTNSAIVESFLKGYISSTTLMANMSGFDDACEKAKMHHLENNIGVHLNLTAGNPLSDRIRSNTKFCDDSGNFIRQRKNTFYLNKYDKADVYDEYSAQIQKVISSGITPTHLDSHHHYHTELGLLALVCELAKAYNIPYVRLSRNCGEGISMIKRAYKSFANHYIKYKGLSFIDYFGSVDDICKLDQIQSYKLEIMVHPIFLNDGTLVDATNNAKMSDNFEKISAIKNFTLKSYFM